MNPIMGDCGRHVLLLRDGRLTAMARGLMYDRGDGRGSTKPRGALPPSTMDAGYKFGLVGTGPQVDITIARSMHRH